MSSLPTEEEVPVDYEADEEEEEEEEEETMKGGGGGAATNGAIDSHSSSHKNNKNPSKKKDTAVTHKRKIEEENAGNVNEFASSRDSSSKRARKSHSAEKEGTIESPAKAMGAPIIIQFNEWL